MPADRSDQPANGSGRVPSGSDRPANGSERPVLPAPGERMPLPLVDPPHPALLSVEDLESECDFRAQRRSGPGGQHRNKTSSGVFLCHQPTGIVAEATERRSQADNRAVALTRLRFRLAVQRRTASTHGHACGHSDDPVSQHDIEQDESEQAVRQAFAGRPLRLGERNPAKPAVLALLLNDLHAAGGQPSLVAAWWSTSTSGIVSLLKSHPPAFALLNEIRSHHGRRALR